MTKKTYQMFWDCSHCGTKELLGISHRHCPNCGAAQDENKRYFPPAGKEVELTNHIYYGVDWDCPYCSTPNSKKSNNCVNCGGPQDGSMDVDRVDVPKKKKDTSFSNNVKMNNSFGSISSSNTTISTPPQKKSNKHTTMLVIVGFIFACLFGFLIYGFFKVTDHTVMVQDKTWSRSIDIEEYKVVNDTDWCTSMPSDSYGISKFKDVRSHRQVADGTSCETQRRDQGDGSYTTQQVCHTKYRSEPVYDYKCHYKVNRWRFSNSEMTSGNSTKTPYFADVSRYSNNLGNILGNKRVGSRSESYKVVFSYLKDDKHETSQCYYSQNTWHNFKIESSHQGKVRMIGGLICDEITSLHTVVTSNK